MALYIDETKYQFKFKVFLSQTLRICLEFYKRKTTAIAKGNELGNTYSPYNYRSQNNTDTPYMF